MSVVRTGRGGGGRGVCRREFNIHIFLHTSPFHDIFFCQTNRKSVFQLKYGLLRDNAYLIYSISVKSLYGANYG